MLKSCDQKIWSSDTSPGYESSLMDLKKAQKCLQNKPFISINFDMEALALDGAIMDPHVTPKILIESDDEDDDSKGDDSMDIPTTVTIVEEDGTTSIVDDASVSSILTDGGPQSSLQFDQNNGNLSYRIVGLSDDNPYQSHPGVQVLSSPLNGQYYVIGSPQEVLGRTLSSRTAQIIDARSLSRLSSGKAAVRDEKKRATHNEVERRRRDKINGWITKLAKIVPSCNDDGTKQSQSKGGILAKACEYINDLRTTNCRLANSLKEHENTAEELDNLRRQITDLRRENFMLKQQLGPTEDDSTVTVTTTE